MTVPSPMDRESLLPAARIIERLREGWCPSDREMFDAPFVDNWHLDRQPLSDGFYLSSGPYVLTAVVYRLPLRAEVVAKPIVALDPDARWVRLLDEWGALGEARPGVFVDPTEVMARAAAWIERQL